MAGRINPKHNQRGILFVGDTSFGENYQEKYLRKGGKDILKDMGYDHPFQNLKRMLLKSDLVVANLETPITDNLKSPIPVSTKKNFHWSDVKKAPQYFKKYNMHAFSLANNHAMDYGLEGLRQTLDVLQKNGMEWIGAGLDKKEAQAPYCKEFGIDNLSFKLAIITGFESRKTYEQELVFYANEKNGGVNKLSANKIIRQIRHLRQTSPDVFIVVFPHWGKNYLWKSEKQTVLAHRFIDAGADLIIGHGSHMMQEIEQYHGRWIVYSVGNFVFNAKGLYRKFNADPFSLVAQLSLKKTGNDLLKTLRLYPILTDNKITNFQARFLTHGEFERAYKALHERSSQPSEFEVHVKTGEDEIGPFMDLLLG